MSEYQVSWLLRLRRGFLRRTFRLLFRILYRVEIRGKENVPANGAYIVIHNHVSVIDPPFLLTFWPVAAEAVGSAHLWNHPASMLIKIYGTLPVNRGEFDRRILEKSMQVLRGGAPLVIAPEGRRSHQPGLLAAQPGVAYLVDKVQAPILPVGIVGSLAQNFRKAVRLQRPTLRMNIGRPFTVPALAGRGKSRRAARQHNADLIMQHLARLLPPEYRGAYAEGRGEGFNEAAE